MNITRLTASKWRLKTVRARSIPKNKNSILCEAELE